MSLQRTRVTLTSTVVSPIPLGVLFMKKVADINFSSWAKIRRKSVRYQTRDLLKEHEYLTRDSFGAYRADIPNYNTVV